MARGEVGAVGTEASSAGGAPDAARGHPVVPESADTRQTPEGADVEAAGADEEAAGANEEAAGTDEEAEDDLQLAWECLETARRCFDSQESSGSHLVRSKVHLRLGDLLMMQNRAEEAVEEYRASLIVRLSPPKLDEGQVETVLSVASASSVAARDGFVRLCMALVRAGRANSFHAAAADARHLLAGLGDDLVQHLGSSAGSAPAASEEPTTEGVDCPVMEIPVRRKRPREEAQPMAASPSKAPYAPA